MEEEGAPPSSRPPLPRPPAASATDTFSSAIVTVSCPPPVTYIVQVPKEQIYRVPPPENAKLAEHYRTQVAATRSQRSPCLSFLLRFLCIFFSVAVLLLIAALIFYIVVRPATPAFSIARIVAKPPSSPSRERTQYEILMEVNNPSNRMGYSFEKGGGSTATLAHKGKIVADGKPPHFYVKAKESKRFMLSLRGTKKAVPEAVEKSLKGSEKAVPLRVTVEMPVKPQLGSLRLWGMKMAVECDLRVKNLGKKTKVFSQECKANV